MIDQRHAWLPTFRIIGSVLPRIWVRLLVLTLLSIPTTYLCLRGDLITLPLVSHSIVGGAVGIHIAFRTNTGWERFWEARTAWGAIVNRTRNLARQLHAMLDAATARRGILLTIAFVHASKRHFWRETHVSEIEALLGADISRALHEPPGPPQRSLLEIGKLLTSARQAGKLDSVDQLRVEQDITNLIDQFGICQRIRSTPLPDAYVIQLRTALALFLLTLPMALVEDFRWYTPPFMLIVAYVMLGMEQIGTELEDPFERTVNDVNMAAISQLIEKDLLALCTDAGAPRAAPSPD